MYTLLTTGDVPGAATYFNPLLQQTIVPCTSGTRPGSPPNGMHIHETDTTRTMKNNAGTWESIASSVISFTPTLTASTNPGIGTGATRNGWYVWGPGATITYNFFIQFGASGATAGSGNYAVSLPFAAAAVYSTGHAAVGSIMLADASAGTFKIGSSWVPNGGSTTLAMMSEGSSIVGAAAPFVWANSDYMSGQITYRTV
jgi:hypothetical protein